MVGGLEEKKERGAKRARVRACACVCVRECVAVVDAIVVSVERPKHLK